MAGLQGWNRIHRRQARGRRPGARRSERRRRAPDPRTAVAKAIVAFLPEAELKGLLPRLRYNALAPRTITTQAAFAAELERVRMSGYAYDDEEHIEGIRCIAAPVFAYSGRVVGSLCVVGPRSRMTRQKLKGLRPEVLTLCGALSKRLGLR
nr:IclR family transcriptional regulator C-terminal domain-containing protein [Bradyrhizobium murdochi]